MEDKRFYVRVRGRIQGPFGLPQLKSLRDRGQFRRFHEISEDRQTWLSAGTLLELFPNPRPTEDFGVIAGAAANPSSPSGLTGPGGNQVSEWYFTNDGTNKQGPVSREYLTSLLQSGMVTESTLVWKEGMEQWVTIATAEETFRNSTRARAAGDFGNATRSREDAAGWRKVRGGVTLALIAAFLYAGMAVIGLFGFLAMIGSGLRSAVTTLAITGILLALLWLGSKIVEIIGYGFCAGAPPRSGAQGLAITTLVLGVANLLLTIVLQFVGVAAGGLSTEHTWQARAMSETFSGIHAAFAILSALLNVAATFFFLQVLRVSARGIRNESLLQSIIYLTIMYAVLIVLGLFFVILIFALAVAQPSGDSAASAFAIWLAVGILLGASALAWWAWYIVILFQMRRSLALFLRGG